MTARRPGCRPTESIASMMASYSAVPPHDFSRSMRRERSSGSVERRTIVKTVSLNAKIVNGVLGGTVPWNRFAAAFMDGMKFSMLPLTSSVITSSSGMFSEAKCVIRWWTLSSVTLKSLTVSPCTNRPPSVTTTGT
jgi:hypothetical protein